MAGGNAGNIIQNSGAQFGIAGDQIQAGNAVGAIGGIGLGASTIASASSE